MFIKKSITIIISASLLLLIGACKTPQAATQTAPPATPATPATPVVSSAATKDYSGYYPNVEAGKYDNGKMWSFSYPPKDYLKQTYGFKATDEWIGNVQKAALRFATYCTASFVSEDGLVMTNHHCGRESVTEVTKAGEDLPTDGFYAATLADERKVEGLFVDQLISTKDVTEEVKAAMMAVTDMTSKNKLRDEKIKSLEKGAGDGNLVLGQVHTFYNGSIYQLYTYRRYHDVRLVLAPETDLGYFGGDPDNFTYPRYTLDYTFFRVYDDNGKPLKTPNHYTWSKDGAVGSEPLFVVGNPGTTKRLSTVSMLEYDRDYTVPHTVDMLDMLTKTYWDYLEAHPEKKLELMDTYFGFSNGQKAYNGIYSGLKDPNLMGKRANFEQQFKYEVFSNPELKAKYGDLWAKIAKNRTELSKYFGKQILFSPAGSQSQLFALASKALSIAEEMKKPADQRKPGNSDQELKTKIAALDLHGYYPEIEEKILEFQLKKIAKYSNSKFKLVDGQSNPAFIPQQANILANNSIVSKPAELRALFDKGPDAVLNSNDQILAFSKLANDSLAYYRSLIMPLAEQGNTYIQELGQALYSVYGTAIPPDANFTLRLADGVVKGYEYNGTKAPEYTTFYGMYDRYYSFDKKAPYALPEKWINTDASFDRNTKYNFVTTHDIIGGNSGSAMINGSGQVVGLIFDGNIESLPGRYIFDTESNNRCVALHSNAIIESIRDIYKAARIADELEASRLK